jgi:hypothetical protein
LNEIDKPPASKTPSSLESELVQAERAFDRGDYRMVAQLVQKLAHTSHSPLIEPVRRLKNRVSPDPVHLGLLLICTVGLFGIAWTYLFPR